MFLSNCDFSVILVHWHSYRTARGRHSTKQTELIAFDFAYKAIETISRMTNIFLKIDISVFTYIEWDSFLSNIMNKTVLTIFKLAYRYKEVPVEEKIHFVCLTQSRSSPAASMTKLKPDNALQHTIGYSVFHASAKHTFMLQKSLFRCLQLNPTMAISMPQNNLKVHRKEKRGVYYN